MGRNHRSWIPGIVFWTLFLLSIAFSNGHSWVDTVWLVVCRGVFLIIAIWALVRIFRHWHDADGYFGYRGVPRWFVRSLGDDQEYGEAAGYRKAGK